MSTKTETANGHERKTLASQLDRLDAILDSLSESLQDTISSAVQQAVGQAVRQAVSQALAEVLSNPDVLAFLRAASAPPPTQPEPPPGKTLGARARDLCRAVMAKAAALKPVARGAWNLAWRHKGRVLAACGVGLALGLTAYWAGPWLGAAAGWASGFAATIAVQARDGLRRLWSPPPSD